MDDRKKTLEAFVKQLQNSSNDNSSAFVGDDFPALGSKAYSARNLSEEALANEVLNNTDVPVPHKGASVSKQEDFLNRIMKERYPELEPDVRVGNLEMHKANGLYLPKSAKIGISKELIKNPLQSVGTMLHEAGHQYDDKVLKYNVPEKLLKEKGQLDIKGMYNGAIASADELDPTSLYEAAAKGHHARIPNLRDADSFGLGALKSMLKSGTFKSVAGALPLAGTALALSSGDANAAMEELPGEVPVLGQAYEAIRPTAAGDANDDYEMKNEVKALQNYDNSPAANDRNQHLRQQALQAVLKK